MKNVLTVAAPVLAAAALSACSKPPPPPVALVPEVATLVVTQQPVLLTTELPGRTAPYRIAEIRPQVSGLILRRLFTEGADVKEGQALYQIDPAPFQAALDNAQAALGRVEASLPAIQVRAARYREALAEKAVSQQDFDDASAALNQAEADIRYQRAMVETAKINLNYARVVAPISGRIGTSAVTDGAIVTAYQPTALATVQQLDPIYVNVPQSATDLLRLRRRLEAGQLRHDDSTANRVRLILPDGADYPLEGTLQFQDVSVDPTTGTVTLRMVFPNPNGVLLPGMFVRGLVQEGASERAILIPQQAVSRDAKGNPVILILDAAGKVGQRRIAVDRAIGDQWLVASGLAPGDRVVVEGVQKARPGAVVKEVPFAGAPRPGAAPGTASAAASSAH